MEKAEGIIDFILVAIIIVWIQDFFLKKGFFYRITKNVNVKQHVASIVVIKNIALTVKFAGLPICGGLFGLGGGPCFVLVLFLVTQMCCRAGLSDGSQGRRMPTDNKSTPIV